MRAGERASAQAPAATAVAKAGDARARAGEQVVAEGAGAVLVAKPQVDDRSGELERQNAVFGQRRGERGGRGEGQGLRLAEQRPGVERALAGHLRVDERIMRG